MWKAEKARFPHLYLGAAFLLLSSCQSQARKYCRMSHRGTGKYRYMLQLRSAIQHRSNRKDFIAKHQKFNCQAVSDPFTPTYIHSCIAPSCAHTLLNSSSPLSCPKHIYTVQPDKKRRITIHSPIYPVPPSS